MSARTCPIRRETPTAVASPMRGRDDDADVRAGDGQQVVEAGDAKRVAELVGEPLVLAEDDSGDDRGALARQPGRDRPGEGLTQPVGRARDAAAPSHEPPASAPADDVHALPLEPVALAEPVVRRARLAQLEDELEPTALRRRASGRQLEQDALAHRAAVEHLDARRNADGELRTPRRSGDDDVGRSRSRRGAPAARSGRARRGGRFPTRLRGAQRRRPPSAVAA